MKGIYKNKDGSLFIEIYDDNLSYDENFTEGVDLKYALLPIYKTPKGNEFDFTRLLNAGGKIIITENFENYVTALEYFVVDFDSIFGLRLLSYQRYNSKFFDCQERVFFEALLIKDRKSVV